MGDRRIYLDPIVVRFHNWVPVDENIVSEAQVCHLAELLHIHRCTAAQLQSIRLISLPSDLVIGVQTERLSKSYRMPD